MAWKREFEKLAAFGAPIAAVDTGGRALALANWGHHMIAPPDYLLGHGWIELAHPADLDRIFAWFAERKNSGPMVHRGMWMADGVASMMQVACVKRRAAGAWLVMYSLAPLSPTALDSFRAGRCRLDPSEACSRCLICSP